MVIISHGPIFHYYNDYRRTCIENALSMLIALLAQPVSAVQEIALSFFNTWLTCFLGLQLTDQHGWLFKLQVCAFAHQHHASSYTWSKLQENHKQNLRSCEPQTFSKFFSDQDNMVVITVKMLVSSSIRKSMTRKVQRFFFCSVPHLRGILSVRQRRVGGTKNLS